MSATANVETTKEVMESFVTFKLGEAMVTSSNITLTVEDDGKRYWIGKVVPISDDLKGIYNEHVNAVIPFICLVGNDEIIDL